MHRQGRIKAQAKAMALEPRGFRGPALSKVKEKCRHSYSLTHEKSEKNVLDCYLFYVSACLQKREAVVTVASHVTPAYILGLGPLKALIRP